MPKIFSEQRGYFLCPCCSRRSILDNPNDGEWFECNGCGEVLLIETYPARNGSKDVAGWQAIWWNSATGEHEGEVPIFFSHEEFEKWAEPFRIKK